MAWVFFFGDGTNARVCFQWWSWPKRRPRQERPDRTETQTLPINRGWRPLKLISKTRGSCPSHKPPTVLAQSGTLDSYSPGGGACSWILLTRKLCFELLLRRHRDDFRPLVEGCGCYCCVNHQRAYLHHLLVTNELLAGVLLMIHNTAHYHAFFRALREALANDKLDVLKRRVLGEGGGQTERNEWLINPTDRRIDPYSPRPPLRSLDSLKALPFCCRGVPPHASEVTLPEADAFNAGGWKDTI